MDKPEEEEEALSRPASLAQTIAVCSRLDCIQGSTSEDSNTHRTPGAALDEVKDEGLVLDEMEVHNKRSHSQECICVDTIGDIFLYIREPNCDHQDTCSCIFTIIYTKIHKIRVKVLSKL